MQKLASSILIFLCFVCGQINGQAAFPGISLGCQKLTGVGRLPITDTASCDNSGKDVCGIISNLATTTCYSTFLDRPGPSGYGWSGYKNDGYLVTCLSQTCSPTITPGLNSIGECLTCRKATYSDPECFCPNQNYTKYTCTVCDSPDHTACYCCPGV